MVFGVYHLFLHPLMHFHQNRSNSVVSTTVEKLKDQRDSTPPHSKSDLSASMFNLCIHDKIEMLPSQKINFEAISNSLFMLQKMLKTFVNGYLACYTFLRTDLNAELDGKNL